MLFKKSRKDSTHSNTSDQMNAQQAAPEGMWLCKKCGTANPKTNIYCKDCGAYK
ncbi:hypothetical protein lbkm_4182 [Lachnospiraceae bacterium KM106-2]|nr:hypothetical protein lbkm_4182 [Lachnospiraceae bacterium KM106-2]